jgi:hypothetical protein
LLGPPGQLKKLTGFTGLSPSMIKDFTLLNPNLKKRLWYFARHY